GQVRRRIRRCGRRLFHRPVGDEAVSVLRGLTGVLVGLAVTVGFVQFLELMLANALAGRALQSMDDYALVLNSLPVLAIRLVVASLVVLLGGYLCAKLAGPGA